MIRRESAPVLGSLAVALLLAFVPPALAAPDAKPSAAPVKAQVAPVKTAPVKAAPAKAVAAKPKTAAAPVIADVPADPLALQIQARAAAARGDHDLAIVLAESAIVADPARASSYDALGDVYAAQKQPAFARNFYQKALDIDPTDVAATQAIAALDRADNRKADASDGSSKSATP